MSEGSGGPGGVSARRSRGPERAHLNVRERGPWATTPRWRRMGRPARREGLIDPEVTDAVVRDAVGRQRWFWLLLLERGPIRDQPRAEADEIQAAHLRHLFTLRKRGQLRLFGPVENAGSLRGIGVLTVPTRDEAETLMADDPAVRAGRLRAEVRPWFTTPGIACPTDRAWRRTRARLRSGAGSGAAC